MVHIKTDKSSLSFSYSRLNGYLEMVMNDNQTMNKNPLIVTIEPVECVRIFKHFDNLLRTTNLQHKSQHSFNYDKFYVDFFFKLENNAMAIKVVVKDTSTNTMIDCIIRDRDEMIMIINILKLYDKSLLLHDLFGGVLNKSTHIEPEKAKFQSPSELMADAEPFEMPTTPKESELQTGGIIDEPDNTVLNNEENKTPIDNNQVSSDLDAIMSAIDDIGK